MKYADMIETCIRIKSHKLTLCQQEENLRSLRLSNDLLESQITMNKEITKTLYNQFAREFSSAEPNERSVARMTQFIQMQNDGLGVILAQNAPIMVRDLFPPHYDHVLALEEAQVNT